MSTEVRRQKKLDIVEEKDFRRRELLRKYIAKMLYKYNDRKFENKYLKKLERNQNRQKGKDKTRRKDKAKSFSGSRNLEGG